MFQSYCKAVDTQFINSRSTPMTFYVTKQHYLILMYGWVMLWFPWRYFISLANISFDMML